MPVDARSRAQVEDAAVRYGAALELIRQRADAQVRVIWTGVTDWYDTALVAAAAAQSARTSSTVQDTVAGATKQYVAATVRLLGGERRPLPTVTVPPIRGGAPLPLVYTRAAEAYRRQIATGASPEEALARALNRAGGLVNSDAALTAQVWQDGLMDALGVTTYRRVLRPELSKSGSCGLCIAAADRIYKVGTLLPIHPPECRCITLPIVDGNDPGRQMNDDDLKRLYADAGGSTAAKDLSRTRYKVAQHGELGPVLTKAKDSFRKQQDVPLEKDPARAQRMLDAALPTLQGLEARAAAGQDVTGPLTYQRQLVARLRRIAG